MSAETGLGVGGERGLGDRGVGDGEGRDPSEGLVEPWGGWRRNGKSA